MKLEFLRKSKLNHLNVISQSHDGVAVMTGHLGGMQEKIKEKYLTAIFIHCIVHRLNLVMVDIFKYILVFIFIILKKKMYFNCLL